MARSQYKNAFYATSVWKNIIKKKLNKIIRGRLLFSRQSSIPEIFSDSNYFIHNGKIYNKVRLNNLTCGKKFGELSVTKKPFFYPKKDKKKR